MLETDSLRKVLQTKALLAASTLSLPLKLGEESFAVPSGQVWGEFWFRMGTGIQMELGTRSSYEKTPGLMQFSLYAPEKSGDGPVLKIADQLKNMWNRTQFTVAPDGYVNFHVIGVDELPGIRNGFKVVIVDGSFDFFHRNPNPSVVLGS